LVIGVTGNVEIAFDVFSLKGGAAGYGQVIADASTVARHAFAAYRHLRVTRGPAPVVAQPVRYTPPAPTATPAPAPTDTPVPNSGATDSGVTVTRRSLRVDTPTNEFAQPSPGKEYVVTRVTITNNSNQNVNYNRFDFKLVDQDNVQYDPDALDTNVSDTTLHYGTLAPGQIVSGDLAFEVPDTTDKAGILWTPSYDSPGIWVPTQ
jgi:hypothetical protein